MLANKFAANALARRALFSNTAIGGVRGMASTAAYDDYGKHVFTGSVADAYLRKHGASAEILKDPSWTKDSSDLVAAAVLDW